MSAIDIIRQGESLDFSFTNPQEDVTGWECQVQVKEMPGGTIYVDRQVTNITATPNGSAFTGSLTSTETDGLPLGTLRLIGVLTKTDDDEEYQDIDRFKVGPSWA